MITSSTANRAATLLNDAIALAETQTSSTARSATYARAAENALKVMDRVDVPQVSSVLGAVAGGRIPVRAQADAMRAGMVGAMLSLGKSENDQYAGILLFSVATSGIHTPEYYRAGTKDIVQALQGAPDQRELVQTLKTLAMGQLPQNPTGTNAKEMMLRSAARALEGVGRR
ncbi:MAG: hypothetical protein AAFY60_15475 [Myxococcota bacterium]